MKPKQDIPQVYKENKQKEALWACDCFLTSEEFETKAGEIAQWSGVLAAHLKNCVRFPASSSGGSKLSATPALGNLMPSSGPMGHCTHGYLFTQRQQTHKIIKTNI